MNIKSSLVARRTMKNRTKTGPLSSRTKFLYENEVVMNYESNECVKHLVKNVV